MVDQSAEMTSIFAYLVEGFRTLFTCANTQKPKELFRSVYLIEVQDSQKASQSLFCAMSPHAELDLNTNRPSPLPDQDVDKLATAGLRSLPTEDPCLSYWHRTTRAFAHLHENHDQDVPAATRYLIIGSGLSGSLTAWQLLDAGVPGEDIVVLEAREAVSGASGRNAGHVRPDAFRGFGAYARVHGSDQAKKIIENERLVLELVDDFVKKHNVPCDFELSTTFDVCLTPEFAQYEAESLEAYRQAGGDVSHVSFYGGEEAAKRTKVASAVAAYEWPAGSSHPAKLAQWILSDMIERGVRLWTHCPATDVRTHAGGHAPARWDVQTPRGTIAAENVVHCTNAYSSYLLPELSRFVTPNRAQAHSFVPTFSLSGANARTSTMSLRYSLHHFFSFIQRRGDGTVIFGVSRGNPEWTDKTRQSIVSFDDTHYNKEVAATSEREYTKIFPGRDGNANRHGEGAEHYWSGIIAMTPDSVPMVGAIDGKPGQWICAGFNGHGMARIFTCAPGLVKLMMDQSWQETGLPECFQYSNDRLTRAEKGKVVSVW
jgi:glycine/D-amino acid oxidase-like deaminating enzyme